MECATDYVGCKPCWWRSPPLSPRVPYPPGRRCFLHSYHTLRTNNVIKNIYTATDHIQQAQPLLETNSYTRTAKLRKLNPSLASRITKEIAERIISNYGRRKTHMDRRQPTSFIHLVLMSMWSYVSTWRATVDDGQGNNADVFPMRYRRQKGVYL